MKIDASIVPSTLDEIRAVTEAAEALGFDALWTSETQHDPFLPLGLVAQHSRRLQFGTAVAIGFARSPTTLAHTAWDLAAASAGRFILGLGTQVRAHVERRFGMPWPDSPVGKLRELIGGIRALWATWQTGQRLNFRGRYFKLTLMSPFFNPGPIEHPDIPIYLAGVNRGLCRLAGELGDGLHAHPLHSVRYLSRVVRPAMAEGVTHSGRPSSSVALSVTAFAVTRRAEDAFVRSQIAFYAATPSYRPVLALHGWGEIAEQLSGLARRQAWDQMPGLITDEMLETFAVVAPPERLGRALKERYAGLVDRLSLYLPFQPGEADDFWRQLLEDLRGGE